MATIVAIIPIVRIVVLVEFSRVLKNSLLLINNYTLGKKQALKPYTHVETRGGFLFPYDDMLTQIRF